MVRPWSSRSMERLDGVKRGLYAGPRFTPLSRELQPVIIVETPISPVSALLVPANALRWFMSVAAGRKSVAPGNHVA